MTAPPKPLKQYDFNLVQMSLGQVLFKISQSVPVSLFGCYGNGIEILFKGHAPSTAVSIYGK